ncbi:hypothetical protein SAMN05444583_1348 [Rhodococcus maanshanensis]|uniref:Uncharacterized protein n=1 Tax=Rhodococcus maanshanensis TaxID=183556 RepID=A0A1H7XQI4_9NOCA|nr:hypothetical protein SAMN05444583_1348 [Rhodococcus maanshanensis]
MKLGHSREPDSVTVLTLPSCRDPSSSLPLPGRRTIVVSARDDYPADVWVARSLSEAVAMADTSD